jgi:hypothetical protein
LSHKITDQEEANNASNDWVRKIITRTFGVGIFNPNTISFLSLIAICLCVWLSILIMACRHDGILFITNQIRRPTVADWFSLSSAGILDNGVIFFMVAALWVLCLTAIMIIEKTHSVVYSASLAFAEVRRDRSESHVMHFDSEAIEIIEGISLARRTERWIYYGIIYLTFSGVLYFQVFAPLMSGASNEITSRSWALLPEYRLTFGIAIVWALFYWIVIVANSLWISLSSMVRTLIFIRRLSGNEGLIIVPPRVRELFSSIISLATWLSISFAVIAMIAAILTIKMYSSNFRVLIGVTILLCAMLSIFAAPIVAVGSAVKRGRERYRRLSLPAISILFKEVKDSSLFKEPALPKSQQTLLEFLVWDRILHHAESISIFPLDARSLVKLSLPLLGQMFAIWRMFEYGATNIEMADDITSGVAPHGSVFELRG